MTENLDFCNPLWYELNMETISQLTQLVGFVVGYAIAKYMSPESINRRLDRKKRPWVK